MNLSIEPIEQKNKTIIDSLSYSKKHKDLKELKSTIKNTIQELTKQGYIDILTYKLLRLNDSSFVQRLRLGKKYKTAKIVINTNDTLIDSLLRIPLSRKRDHTSIDEVDHYTNQLFEYLKARGYPFTEIKKTFIKTNDSDTVQINLTIKTDESRTLNNIVIKGYEKFPKKFLDHILKKQYLINDTNLNRISTKLKQIPFITITKQPEILFKRDSTILYIYVEKKQNNLIDGLIGFNNNDGRKLELNGTLDLQLMNNLNNGEQLSLLYRGDDQDQTRLDIHMDLPYLFQSKVGLSAGLNLLRRDSTYQNTTFNGGIFYSLKPQTNGGIKYSSTRSSATEGINNSTNYNSNNIILTFNHIINAPDDLFLYNEYANIEVGTGERNTDSNTNNQFKIKARLKKNIYLSAKQSLNIESQLLLLNSNDIIFNELFQVGGINSIRGFNQNSIDTSFFTALNTEYRYKINNGIYLHSILDYAIFEDFTSRRTQNIYGLGIGTAILTQSGILRISIANGSFSGANLDFSSTVAHVNMRISF